MIREAMTWASKASPAPVIRTRIMGMLLLIVGALDISDPADIRGSSRGEVQFSGPMSVGRGRYSATAAIYHSGWRFSSLSRDAVVNREWTDGEPPRPAGRGLPEIRPPPPYEFPAGFAGYGLASSAAAEKH